MNDIKVFNSPVFGEIRTAGTADEPLFCLADVCRVLELQVQNCKKRLDEKGVYSIITPTNGGEQAMLFINEKNLYKVIMRSDKPQAEPFQDWVCGDLLPTIRRTGGYIVTTESMSDEEIMARAILIGQKTIERQKAQIAQLHEQNLEQRKQIEQQQTFISKAEPKVRFANAVGKSDDTISIDLMAKLLAQNGVPNMGEKRLFVYLRQQGFISDQKHTWNRPYQKWVEKGLFRIETSVWKNSSTGEAHISYIPRVTTKGQEYFVRLFTKNQPQMLFGVMTSVS